MAARDLLGALVRGNRRRGFTFLVTGFLTFLIAGLVIGISDDRQERLVREGERLHGVVVDADNPLRGPSSVTVRYRIEGDEHQVHIVGSNSYVEGEDVTVYVDRADPTSATLAGEQPQSSPTYYFTLVLVVVSLFLLVAGAASLWRAWRER